MAEVVAGHRRGGQHRETFGQGHVGVGGGVEQTEDRAFLAVLGTGRIAGRRADAAIGLVDQRVVVERLVAAVAPEFLAHALVQALGEGFGESVGQRLQQDRVVIVVIGLEVRDVRVDADACGDRERADPVLLAAVLRRDEVGQAEIGAVDGFVDLLAEEVEGGF